MKFDNNGKMIRTGNNPKRFSNSKNKMSNQHFNDLVNITKK